MKTFQNTYLTFRHKISADILLSEPTTLIPTKLFNELYQRKEIEKTIKGLLEKNINRLGKGDLGYNEAMFDILKEL